MEDLYEKDSLLGHFSSANGTVAYGLAANRLAGQRQEDSIPRNWWPGIP
jgi:hypothetical protein